VSEIKPTTHLDEDLLLTCMRCGFCLPACPTYRHRQVESASPRGRIALMRAVQEEQLDILDIQDQLDACLGCRACESACPAGVTYGALLEQGRAELATKRPNPWAVRFAYKWFLGTPAGIRLSGQGLWFYQRSGLRALARKLGLVAKLGGQGLAGMERAIPDAASPARRAAARRRRVTPAVGERKLKVAFFLGCLSDIAFFETNQNAIAVLAAAGCEVDVTPGQGCCGAVHGHAGEHDMALEQAKRNIVAFERGDYDYIVNTAGGCGAALKEYGRLLKDDPAWAQRAQAFSLRCRDFSELVATLELPPLRPIAGTITYQDSCHLRNGQKVIAQPRKLLQSIPGARYVELPEADRCCGAAGTYAVSQAAMSDTILDHKMNYVKGTQATTVVVANPPCQLEMIEGVERAGLQEQVKVRHIADVLAEALPK
jgi:glycolate oxidase iron-sulfur subunit